MNKQAKSYKKKYGVYQYYTHRDIKAIAEAGSYEKAKELYPNLDCEPNLYERVLQRWDKISANIEKNKTCPHHKAKQREWIQKNYEHVQEYARQRRQNPEVRARIQATYRTKMKTDPIFKTIERLRIRVYHALKGMTKSKKTVKLLGCTPKEFAEYLEKQFTPEMNWDNYGPYWHVDHIIPVSAFDLSTTEGQHKAFHYSNCRPLTKIENLRKGAKLPEQYESRKSQTE